MIYISSIAQKYLKKLLLKQKTGTQIRIFVINPGTSFAECGISYCCQDEIEFEDMEFQFDGFFVYVNKFSVPYLKNTNIDLIIDNLGSQLSLKAPFSKINLLNKNPSLEERLDYTIKTVINPQLALHGGQVSLVKITDQGYVMLKFSGGCNGCSMVDLTLKNGIEKKLLTLFPELKGVLDITKHNFGTHSYHT